MLENWHDVNGLIGNSLIYFDRNDQQWHQSWIDTNGSSLALAGGFIGGVLTLSGTKPNTGELHEIQWRPLKLGRVEQIWRMSLDNGATWTPRFRGIYYAVDQQN
ncbi:hypothetical protein AAW51_1663 [Caldimonas brevitalea]|uniref:Uncharacterized protein n=1 Tax=Caldimonas brevitalea TaxID=413882 RepID=A0A0G3BG11_9BURK|nr:hypothetical protein AAW51_1663 [Caldimonas brevitalea]